jgi:hypothetical protein
MLGGLLRQVSIYLCICVAHQFLEEVEIISFNLVESVPPN